MNKPYPLYTALTKAVDDFNDRHALKRDHLAQELGYRGENAGRQLSNALNPNNTDKSISDHRKSLLLHAMDEEARMTFFAEWMRQWGLRPVSMSAPNVCSIKVFATKVDDAQMEADESFKTSKIALRDGTLTEDELRSIIKEATDAMRLQEEIILMANERLKEMGVLE